MNFLDPYDIAGGSNTPPPNQPERSLNEEVSQVIGQLNSFWGGFRKQSQSALETARKDFTGVVSQAQKEFTRLTSDAPTEGGGEGQSGPPSDDNAQPRASSETLKPAVPSEDNEGEPSTSTAAPTLLSRLQSALPPNVVSTVQQHLPESLKHVAETTDFAQLRTNLTSELQRLQGVTRAQAEEYVHKSEALLREAGEVLKDAVKVIPPEASSTDRSTGLVWDGSDMWMLPSDTNDSGTPDKGKGKATAKNAVATRAEALLKRLKHDPEIIKHDPEAEQSIRELYTEWAKSEYEGKGGFESEHWSTKIDSALKDGDDGQALQTTMDSVVPSLLSKDDFWKRYFFRVHQIQTEEEKRKALIQGTVESDEDFSWEDDDAEESTESKATPTPPAAAKTTDDTTTKTPSSTKPHTPANASPRESSEESYDLVSSGNVSGREDKTAAKKTATTDSDDGDSDWE